MKAYENLPPIYAPAPQWMQESLRSHGVGDTMRVVWDKQMKRWEVQTLGLHSRRWSYVFLWAHYRKDGSVVPRDLPFSAKPLIEWLHRIDIGRFGRTPEGNWKAAIREMDEARAQRVLAVKRERDDQIKHIGRDVIRHARGEKQVFGAGHIRSRGHRGTGSLELSQAIASCSEKANE